MRIFCAAILSAAALVAQSSKTAPSYTGQSWVGLLVSAGCNTARAATRPAADKESNLTTSDRVTTPAVDTSGTRGQHETAAAPPHNASPKTGDIHGGPAPADPGWKAAQKQAAALPSSCAVDKATSRFSLLLPDGRVLPFDNLAGQEIARQLNAAGQKTIYRVQVAGKLQQGAIALDTIRM